ncbi:MAG: HD domain-containing protein [Nitrososphaeraceae archaeon]
MKTYIKRIYDPLYGLTNLSDFEYEIIISPEVQRLRYIRMCNINSLLVTGASEISRFEHVLGVLRLAKEWVKVNGRNINEQGKRELYAAALLHDFQTGPFGHSLQYVFEDNETDEQFVHEDITHGTSMRFHQITDANASFAGRFFSCKNMLGDSWIQVGNLIKGEGHLGILISGTIDLDNIDNVIRLAYHVGIAKSEDSEIALSLAKDVLPFKGKIEISYKSIELIKKWQDIRHRLYKLLLLDWAEFSAKAMLTRALELAIQKNLLGEDCWLMTDIQLFDYLETESKGDKQEIGALIKRIRCGNLYVPAFLMKSPNIDKYNILSNIKIKKDFEQKLQNEILEKLKIRVNLIIHSILDHRKTDRLIDVYIRESDEYLSIGCDSRQLLVGVFLSSEIKSEKKNDELKKLIVDYFTRIGLENIIEIEDPMLNIKTVQLEVF